MSEERYCPECNGDFDYVDRRNFIRVVGERTAALAALAGAAGGLSRLQADDAKPVEKAAKPAEDLIRELHSNLSEAQKKEVILPWDHKMGNSALPTRLGMYNGAILKKTIGENYTKPQQELVQRILKSISSDDAGFKQLTRNGTYDGSKSFENCGALIFGDPTGNNKFSWVFSGHHITVRCDGNSEEGAAFGGPMYYGHSPNGYSDKNCFNYQTKAVLSVYEALDEKQRKQAVVAGSPGEHAPSIRFKKADEAKPGIGIMELSKDQRALVESVMRTILSPYRKEDADEVMSIVKANGGLEKIHLAFYQDKDMADSKEWHFWRLEGPGFVWNYRVLDHVHTYVNISSKI